MADAVSAFERAVTQDGFEVGELAGSAADVEPGGVVLRACYRDAGGVIAAVLQAAQAFDDQGDDILRADVTNDSAHDAEFRLGSNFGVA